MSQHLLPQRTTHRVRSPFTSFRGFAVATLVLGAALPAFPNDPIPPTAEEARPAAFSDVVLARSALTALDSAAELRGVNLVVSVVDRVALIGGPVPTTAVSKRAEQVVRAVPGVRDVKNTCFVSIGPDPLLKAVADRLGSSLPDRPKMAELPGVLTPHPTPAWSPPSAVVGQPPTTTTVTLKPAIPVPDVVSVLGSPVGPVGATKPAPIAANSTPTVLTGTGKPGDILGAASEVKNAEARFARLTVELRDGTLVIGGSAPLAADAWDFAQKLRQIPGVTRVAVGTVMGK